MKSNLFVASLFVAAALGASHSFAGEADGAPVQSRESSTLSRDAVRADYLEAMKNGTLPRNGEGYTGPALPEANKTLTREAVRAEYFAAQKNGTLPRTGQAS